MSLRPAAIELVVADMAATLRFYRFLGLELPDDADEQPHVELDLGAMKLAFDTEDTIRGFDAGWTPPTGGHRVALAFECDSAAHVDTTYARLTGAGYAGHLPPFDALWGQRYAVVRDPDGVPVDLFAAARPTDDGAPA